MKIKRFTYQLFYTTGFLALLAVLFTDNLVIYFKPPVIISLCLLYIVNAKHKNYLVLFSLVLVLVCEVLFFYDYIGNFEMLHILLCAYYFLNIILLWKSLQIVKIRFKKVFTIQLVISMALIGYVLYAVAELIMPQISNHSTVLTTMIFFFAVFVMVCYYIYLNSKTVVSYSLMVAASCFLIVNIITALNRFYIYLEVFPVITTVIQILGQFFLIKFFMEQHKLSPNNEDYF